jgi:hypothetical protein
MILFSLKLSESKLHKEYQIHEPCLDTGKNCEHCILHANHDIRFIFKFQKTMQTLTFISAEKDISFFFSVYI